MNIISNNPFRILGVPTNASAREIAANQSRLKAYLAASKTVSFPLDCVGGQSPLIRNTELVGQSTAGINLPQGKLTHALFWFIKPEDSVGAMAWEYLVKGDEDKALELFSKRDTFAALVNRSVLAFIAGECIAAITCMSKVIQDEAMRTGFVNAVAGDTFQISEDELAELFFSNVFEEIDAFALYKQIVNSADPWVTDYTRKYSIQKSFSFIEESIAKAKSIKGKDPDEWWNAGKELINSTEAIRLQLFSVLGKSDSSFQRLADKLALQILQCGINYYNNADEDEATEVNKAYEIQNYSLSIAVGKLAIDRCKQNVEILEKKRRSLPPKEIKCYDELLKIALVDYQNQGETIANAIKLIEKCVHYLMSIKAEVGQSNEYYLKISTIIVNAALHNVIEEFNSIMNDSLEISMVIDRHGTMAKVVKLFDQAWKATLYMDKLDKEYDFENGRYKQNRASLKEQVEKIVNTNQKVVLDMRPELVILNECRTTADYQRYFEIFPQGKHTISARKRMEECEFKSCKTVQDCQRFSAKYPKTQYSILEKSEDCFYESCKTLADFERYISNYPNGRHRNVVEAILIDERFWNRCTAANTKSIYREYLAQFPNGRHKYEAEEKAKACYIATMVYGNYGHPQVLALREFRDTTLRHSSIGNIFIKYYYKHSPSWVEKLQDKPFVNHAIRLILDTFIKIYTNTNSHEK